jgi:hypothetical protein
MATAAPDAAAASAVGQMLGVADGVELLEESRWWRAAGEEEPGPGDGTTAAAG